MNNTVRNILSLVLMAAGIGGFWWLGTPVVPTRPPIASEPPLVKTVLAAKHQAVLPIEIDGVVVPYQQVDIAAQVSGRLAFKADNCRVGRAVKKDELLLRIEPDDYELNVERIGEELNQARGTLDELAVQIETVDNQIAAARQQLDIDVRTLERITQLNARRAASEQEIDTAKRAELTSRVGLQTLIDQKNLLTRSRTRLESAAALSRANLKQAKLDLRRTEIRSPIDGVVIVENVEQNGFVQAGSPVITIQDTSRLDITCKLQIRQMNWLWQGEPNLTGEGEVNRNRGDLAQAYEFPKTPAEVIYDLDGRSYSWTGVVDRYDGGGIDRDTRMVPCRVHVSEPLEVSIERASPTQRSVAKPPSLMTGMFVKVRINAKPAIPLVRLPQSSIQAGNKVWTVRDGRLQSKTVTIAHADDKYVVAYQSEGGLRAGDAVVVTPIAVPVDGLLVRPVATDDATVATDDDTVAIRVDPETQQNVTQ